MDCSPPGSSAHRISQARRLVWVAMSFSRGSSRPRDQTHVSYLAGWDGWMAYWLNGHESEQALGVGNGQGSLASTGLQRVRHDWATELNWTWQVDSATEPAQKSRYCWYCWRIEHFSAVIFSRGKTYHFKPIKKNLNPYYSYISEFPSV